IDVIGKERPPVLGRRALVASHVSGHGRLADLEAELQEFAMASRRTPELVRCRHPANEQTDIRRDDRSTQTASAFPCPEQAEAAAVPGEDSLRFDDYNGCTPSVPEFRQPDPQHAVGMRES